MDAAPPREHLADVLRADTTEYDGEPRQLTQESSYIMEAGGQKCRMFGQPWTDHGSWLDE